MKKLLLLYFLLLVFSLCKAQDTLVFIKGGRQVVKIIYVGYAGEQIIYSLPPGDKELFVSRYKVCYIKYANGSIYTVKQVVTAEDTVQLPIVNLAFNAGASNLIGGYGSTFNNPYDNEYCGFANGGITANLTLNLRLGREGWTFTAIGDYIRNPFDAAGLLNEYGEGVKYNYSGNAVYNHFALLGGLTKTWYYPSKKVYFGVRFMMGQFFFNFPKLSGTCKTPVYNTANKSYADTNCNWTVSQKISTETVYQIGFTFGEYLTKHLNLFENCDLLFGTKEYIDGPSVQIITPANYTSYGGCSPNPAPYLAMVNLTAGIAYTFGK